MSKNKTAVVYARVGSSKQKSYDKAIIAQIRNCVDYANKNDLTVIASFTDIGASKNGFYDAVRKAVRENVSYFLLDKFDRFPRNIQISLSSIHSLSNTGIKVVSATETFSSFDNNHGVSKLIMITAIRAFESETKSQRAKDALTQKSKQ